MNFHIEPADVLNLFPPDGRHRPEARQRWLTGGSSTNRSILAFLKSMVFVSYVKAIHTDVIQRTADISSVASPRLAAENIEAIKTEIITTGGFTLPSFRTFIVRETPNRSALNP